MRLYLQRRVYIGDAVETVVDEGDVEVRKKDLTMTKQTRKYNHPQIRKYI
jgi:hypothetical protein